MLAMVACWPPVDARRATASVWIVTAPPVDEATLDRAVAMARTAGDLTLQWFRSSDLAVDRKDDGTPVTAADRAAERHLRELLAADFPDDGILGEEEAPVDSRSGRRWIIDPIDGTKAFTCGVPLYSTLLALEDEHGIAVGVVHLPALAETVWAGRGLGLLVRPRPGPGERGRRRSTAPT